MLEQQATVVNIDANNDVWVLAARQSACGSCQQSEQCHPSSVLTAPSLAIQVKKNQHDLKIGDEVVIEIAEKTLWHGLFYLYVYPLGALVVGAMLGQFLSEEWGAVIMASVCFMMALVHVTQLTQHQNDNYLPTVIKKLN